jgi:glutathione S-transferase
MLEAHLGARSYVVGDSCTIADIANFAYVHVADDAGLRLADHPSVSAWLARVRSQPSFIDDLAPCPDNARAGASRSIYDS